MTTELSPTQRKVLTVLARNQVAIPLAGKGRAPYLSAARALVRKGFAYAGAHTGWYGATDAGRAAVAD